VGPLKPQWTVRARKLRHPRRVVHYGTAPSCRVEAWLPLSENARAVAPVAVLLHGGYWRDRYNLRLMDPLALDLARRGWLAWNVEYRRVGADGGGWPTTFDDVAAAISALDRAPIAVDRSRVVAIGHSAGGHLALWAAAETGGLSGVVAQAPVSDLHRSWREHASNDAGVGLLGGTPAEHPERYDAASPARRLPIGVPQLVVHGDADANVPYEMSVDYVAAANAAGDDVELATIPGGDHFAVIDPTHEAWRIQLEWLERPQ
jgi:dipeptidyl aminopeptidase/acylaminoacyl peptidase